MAPVFHNKIFCVEFREFYDAPPIGSPGPVVNTSYIGGTASSVRSWTSQLPILRDTSSSASQKITILEIHGTDPNWLDHYPASERATRFAPVMRKADFVEMILSASVHLPNIHGLTLMGFHWDIDFTPASRAMLLQLRTKVTQLTLGDMYFSSIQSTVEFITSFIKLDELVWQEPIMHPHPPADHVFRSASNGQPVRPGLVDLTYMKAAKGTSQPWVIGSMTMSSFMAKFPVVQYFARHATRLELVNTDRHGLATESFSVQEMLDGCGSLLKELRVGVWVWLDDLSTLKDQGHNPSSISNLRSSLSSLRFSLRTLSALRSIHLLDFPFHPCQVDVPFLLSSNTSPALEKLVLEIDFGSRNYQQRELADLLDYDWSRIDEALSRRDQQLGGSGLGRAGSSNSNSPLVSPEGSPERAAAYPTKKGAKSSSNSKAMMKTVKFKLYRSPYTDYPVTDPIRAAMPWAESRGLLRFTKKSSSA